MSDFMSLAHLHLMLTHFPIVGLLFGMLLLGWALFRTNRDWACAGLALLAVTAVLAIPLYFTGEEAEEAIEKVSGISHKAIHQHEESAEVTFPALIGLGALSLLALFFQQRKEQFLGAAIKGVLLLGVLVFGLTAWTANLGGKIRHAPPKVVQSDRGTE